MKRRVLGLVAAIVLAVAGLVGAQVVTVPGARYFAQTLLFSPDNTYDIGASGSTRPHNGFFGTNVVAGGKLFMGLGVASIDSPSDGVMTLLNATATDFTRLQFGGTTSSFPALRRNATGLECVLADASAYCTSLIAAGLQANDAIITQGAGTGITINSGGRLTRHVYKVTIDESAFVCAAVTCDVTIATLPTKTVLVGVYADLTTTFACSSVCTTSTLLLQAGRAGGAEYLASFDADAAADFRGNTDAELGTEMVRAAAVQGGQMPGVAGNSAVTLRLTSGTGNVGNGSVNTLSQGSVTLFLITERLP